jgi:hypothetical protein
LPSFVVGLAALAIIAVAAIVNLIHFGFTPEVDAPSGYSVTGMTPAGEVAGSVSARFTCTAPRAQPSWSGNGGHEGERPPPGAQFGGRSAEGVEVTGDAHGAGV